MSTYSKCRHFWLALVLLLPAVESMASASPTETVMEMTEGTGEITSSSTSDKLEAHQLAAQAENYYADPTAAIGSELQQQVKQLQQQHPELSTGEAVDFIYERALKQ